MPADEHMRDVTLRYAELLSARDIDALVKLFAADARIEDPVGSQPKFGRDAIRAAYLAGFEQTGNSMTMKPEGAVRVSGNEAGCAMIVNCRMGDQSYQIETLDTMVFDEDGLIASLRAHVGPLNFHPLSN